MYVKYLYVCICTHRTFLALLQWINQATFFLSLKKYKIDFL